MRSRIAVVAIGALSVAAIAAATVDGALWARSDAPTPPTPPAAPPTAPALDDATIVAIFDAANTADMETGALAAERGASKEVRDFGAMLVTAHRQVRQQGRDLARKLGVTPTPPRDDPGARAHAEAMTRLRAVDGAAFDRAFLRHEIAFHKAVLDAVGTTLLPAIENGELRAFVVKVGPAFEGHMIGAQAIERRLAGSGTD
jgi:putative membrane protein